MLSPEDYLRVNKNALISDKEISWQLMKDSAFNNSFSTDIIGTKKLIYYSVYGEYYIKLFEKSLESLLKTSSKDFDVLVICDLATKIEIKKLAIFKSKEFKIVFHLVEIPVDGIEASMNKTKIFDYEYINDYSHILFLDCDIIAIKDVNFLFDKLTNNEKFYCICNPSVNSGGYLGIYHGLNYNKDEVFTIAVKQRQKPFNAGQFAFINSLRMRNHFLNINSFINNWDGPYFFEQVFMNIYFLYSNCCDNILSDFVCLANASVNNLEAKHSPSDVLIHFIAPALSGEVKLDYLTQYFDAHKL